MVSRAPSYRIDSEVKKRLAQRAAAEGIAERALLERLVSEGLDMLHHLGVVYRDGPSGRRAALAVRLDVWQGWSLPFDYEEGERATELQLSSFPSRISTGLQLWMVRSSLLR
jgi:hypothetical protein